jgi:hypothetical protein
LLDKAQLVAKCYKEFAVSLPLEEREHEDAGKIILSFLDLNDKNFTFEK